MAEDRRIYVNYDMLGNILKNFSIERLATAPVENLQAGRFYYDTVLIALGIYNGATWDYIYVVDDSGTTVAPWSASKIISYVATIASGLEWQNSVITSTVLDPVGLTPSDGDRYLINGTGDGDWTGHDNEIAQWSNDASDWVYTSPTTGMFVAADDETTGVFNYGGVSWSLKVWENTSSGTGVTIGDDSSNPYDAQLSIDTATAGATGVTASTDSLAIVDADASTRYTGDTVKTRKVSLDAFIAGIIDTTGSVLTQDGTTKKIKVADASTTQKGVSELATEIETKTITDTVRTVTPSNLASFIRVAQVTISSWDGSAPDYSKTLTAGVSAGDYDLGSGASDIIDVKCYVAGVEVEMGVDRSVAGQITISASDNPSTVIEIMGKGYTA